MSTDGKPGQPPPPENPLRDLITLALPWLKLQRHVLDIAKKNVQDADTIKHAKNFTLHELHALMMIVDPSSTIRNRLDGDFEKKVEKAYNEIVPQLTSASVQLIEAQQKALTLLSEGLNNLRKAEKDEERGKPSPGEHRPPTGEHKPPTSEQ